MPDSDLINQLTGNSLLSQIANPKVMPPNLLANAQGAGLDIANKIWANRLAQSQQAAGEAFQNSIGPDGMPNQTLLNRNLVAAGPNAALSAQDAAQKGQTLDNATFTTQQARLSALANANLALYSQTGGMPTQEQISANLDSHGPQLGFTPAQIAQAKSLFGPDPKANGAIILQNTARGLNTLEALHNATPGTGTVDNGQQIQGIQTPAPLSGQAQGAITPVGPQIQTGYPSRTTLLTQHKGTDANNNPTEEPLVSRANKQGVGGLTGPAGGDYSTQPLLGGQKTPVPGSADMLTNPDLAGQTEGPPGSKATPVTRQQPQSGAVRTGQSPQLLKVQQDSIDQYGADSRAAGTYQDRILPLQQAAKALATAKTGDGSETLQTIASRIQTLTPDALKNIVPNIRTPDEIAAYDEARKYLTMAQQNRPGADRSDAGLATAGASSPSTHISPAAAKLLVQAQLGVERSKQAQLLEFNATHAQGTEGQYARWLSDRAAQIDPRAFITDQQTPAERKSYYDRLGDTEKANYLQSYKLAKDHGLLTLPNGQ